MTTATGIAEADTDYPPKLSLGEKTKLYLSLAAIVSSTLLTHGVGGIFRDARGAQLLRIHLVHAIVRKMNDSLSDREYQYLIKPTEEAYNDFARKKNFPSDTVPLPRYGGKGHWIGDKKAKNVLVYYHGGGFAISANDVYFDFCTDLCESLAAAGHELAIFFVSYSLTPQARYPTQLKQCVEALRYILTTANVPPAHVYLGGDSAGANVALAVVLHLSDHAHPAIVADDAAHNEKRRQPLVEDDQYLGGIFCLGPWVSFDFDRRSERENRERDCLSKKSERAWAARYLDYRNGDPWSEPALAPAEWWANARVREFLILTGSDEILLNGIEDFAEKVQSAFPNLNFFVGQNEGHVSPIIDRALLGRRDRDRIQTAQALKRWFERSLDSGEADATTEEE